MAQLKGTTKNKGAKSQACSWEASFSKDNHTLNAQRVRERSKVGIGSLLRLCPRFLGEVTREEEQPLRPQPRARHISCLGLDPLRGTGLAWTFHALVCKEGGER